MAPAAPVRPCGDQPRARLRKRGRAAAVPCSAVAAAGGGARATARACVGAVGSGPCTMAPPCGCLDVARGATDGPARLARRLSWPAGVLLVVRDEDRCVVLLARTVDQPSWQRSLPHPLVSRNVAAPQAPIRRLTSVSSPNPTWPCRARR